MWVSEETLQWLIQNQIIHINDAQQTGEDRFEFTRPVVLNFENGLLFGRIAQIMTTQIARSQKRPETPLPQLDSLKELNSPQAKIYNWNILVQIFKKFSVTVDPDVKSLIIAGDHDMIQELLKELQAVSFTWNPPMRTGTQASALYANQSYLSSQGNNKYPQSQQTNKKDYKEVIDLTKIDLSKDVSKCKSCLEFFIIILSKHLELDPKQTASLFTHGNKYLAHVLAKGVKGLFDPIISFYSEVYSNIDTLIRLFNEDPTHKSMHFSLNALKPGLVAKSFDVAEWAAKLFSELALKFSDNILLMHAWEWFVGQEGSGLNMVLLGLKRHPDLKSWVVSILLQFARFNFVELFITHLKRGLPDKKDRLNCYTQLFPSLMQKKASREEIVSTGILDDWIDTAFEGLADEFKNYDLKCAALNFLCEVWIIYPSKIEDQEMKANNLINYLAKSIREKSQSLQYTSLVLQFRLLLQLALDKNPYAPILYKTLTLSLIENNSNSQMREFILNNFITIFQTLESIPLHILIEPFIKQIQVTEQNQFVYNVFDFNFFTYISKHDKIQLKHSILLLDLLAKVYLNNFVYSQLATVPILNLIQRFIDDENMQEFTVKFIKIALAMFFASEKRKKAPPQPKPLYNNKAAQKQPQISPQELDAQFIAAQKRSLIVQMIQKIVQLGNGDLNEKVKPLVAHTNIQIKNLRGENNKGMMSILELFGDAEVVMKKYEDDFKEHQKLLQQEEKDNQEKDDLIAQSQIQQIEGTENKDETMMLIEQNLSKYGIGHKHAKLTKDEVTRLALLRNPKASQKTLKELQQIKTNFANKQELNRRIDEKNQSVLEVRKKVNRSTLAVRAQEQNVGNFNQIDQENNMLFEYGKREQQLAREGKMGIPQIIFIDLETEEERDKEMIGILMKKYNKALRYLFLRYANTGFNIKQKHAVKKTFDSMKEVQEQLSIPESWKMLSEFGINKQKGIQTVHIKQDQYYKELTINKERVKKSKLNRETGIYEVVVERDFDSITPLENELIVKLTNKWMAEQKNKKKGILSVLPKNDKLYIHSQEDAKYASTDQRGNKRDLYKAHQNFEKTENQNLDFEAFTFYFIQVSVHTNSRFPSDLRHLPMSFAVQITIDRIRDGFKEMKLNTHLFDNPEGAHFGEDEVIQKYNAELLKNPKFILPEGYTKRKEKEITFNYAPPQQLMNQVSESWNDCYSILLEILEFKDIGLQLYEPKSTVTEVVRAHPLFNDGMKGRAQFMDLYQLPMKPHFHKFQPKTASNAQDVDISQVLKKADGSYVKHMKSRATQSAENLHKILPGTTFKGYINKYGTNRNLKIDNYHKLSLPMKLCISSYDYKNRWTAEQVAYVLDDMIKVVESNNRKQFVKEGFYHPENPVKQYNKLEKEQQSEQMKQKDQKYQKLKKAKIFVAPNGKQYTSEEEYLQAKDVQKKEERIKQQKEKEEQEKQKEKEQQEKKQQFREKWVKQQREKATQRQEEKKQQQEQLKQEREEAVIQKEEKRKEDYKEFSKQKKTKYFQEFRSIEQKREEKAKQEKDDIRLKKPRREKLYKKIIENDKERNELEKNTNEKLTNLYKSEEVQKVFLKYETQIKYLFQLLKKYTYKPIGAPRYEDEINLKTFNWFCFHFGLYPEVMHYLDSILVYRSVTTDKDAVRKKDQEKLRQKGMDYELFLQGLVRIACKGKRTFNNFAKNLQDNDNELNKTNINNLANQQQDDQQSQQNDDVNQSVNQSVLNENNNPDNKELDDENNKKYTKLVDDYGKIEDCNATTLECLILYLALPEDRQGMDERFRSILEEGYKPDIQQKRILLQKMKQNPRNLAKQNESKFVHIDEQDDEEDGDDQDNNNILGDENQQQQQDGDEEQQEAAGI